MVTSAIATRQKIWQEWLGIISQDIFTVYFWRATWLTLGDIIRSNPDVGPSHLFSYMSNVYGSSQAVAVRRLADERRDVVSLAALIKDMNRHARAITADWWISLHPAAEARDFRQFAAPGTDYFDAAIASRDLTRLRAAVGQVKKYVDEHVAHRDRNRTKDTPTFADIHAAVDVVGDVFRTYHTLLTTAVMTSLVPDPDLDWFQPLTVPWVKAGSAPRLRGTYGADPL